MLEFEAQVPSPIVLYDYQEEDRAKVAAAFLDHDLTRQLGVWPTGSGKTILFSELHMEPRLEAWLQNRLSWKRKILVIAHRDVLIQQAVDKIKRSNPTLKVGVEKANQRHHKDDDVVVASVQTLNAARGKRLHKMRPDEYAIVVIDEAHHAASPSYHAILQHFGFLPPASYWEDSRPTKAEGKDAMLAWQRARLAAWDNEHDPGSLLLGVTATSKRGDNIGLECVFQEITFNRTIREMIERGRLSRIKAYRVRTQTSLDDVKTRAGDLAQDELAKAVNHENRNAIAVRAYLDHAAGRKGITFCVNIAHAVSMAQAYRLAGVKAKAIHGNLSDEERDRILGEYRRGEIQMLTNCQILTEGFDEPDVQVIIHARPTKSSLLYIQMTGRGLRVAPGKEDCIVIDIVDITKKHSLFTSPELLGLPTDFDAKGGDLLELKQTFEATEKAHPLVDLTTAKEIDDLKLLVSEVDLFSSFHDENIDNHATLVWRRTGDGYELDWRGDIQNEAIAIEPEAGRWQITHKKGESRVQYRQTVNTPEEAFRAAEAYLKDAASHIHRLKRRDASWRQHPATETQIAQLKKFGIRGNVENMTKGDAENLIQKFWAEKRANDRRSQ